MAKKKTTTLYNFVRMGRLIMQRYDVEYKNEDELDGIIHDIESGNYEYQADSTFEYEPEEVMGKLDFEMSHVYEGDIEDDESLKKNALDFLQ